MWEPRRLTTLWAVMACYRNSFWSTLNVVIKPYAKGISEKFRLIRNRFNVRTMFKAKHTLRGTMMKTGPVRDAQQTKQCVYSILCDCGRCYVGETSRPLEVCQIKVKVTLRLTVSQSVILCVKPHLGPTTTYLLLCDSYGLVLVGGPL
jgi:hypothetical protein